MSKARVRELRLRWFDMRTHPMWWTDFQSCYTHMKGLITLYGD